MATRPDGRGRSRTRAPYETPLLEPDGAAGAGRGGPGGPDDGAGDGGAGGRGGGRGGDTVVALREAAEARYLNYALSVITSRALPDVRDGLKPVQRRILYTMWRQGLRADAKPRKCAKVVGDVMGSYHPHGDAAIYDTLVRLAQPFTLRVPLVDGAGNFGSLDGDGAAAMRYTECRLAPAAAELLQEIDQGTVPFQPNYDGTREEPVVLPARLPTLLVNGAAGIAVGMATTIPPHNPGEVAAALLRLIDDPEADDAALARDVRGPDFPTGGRVLNTDAELADIYRTGAGTVRVRGVWEPGPRARATKTVHVISVPYGVNKAQLVERIADVIVARRLPPLLDVRDVSTDDVRIELELKADADDRMVMAYLCRHTPLQATVPVNLTCLVPTSQPGVGRPGRLGLKAILRHFLDFRLDVVTRRLEHERDALRTRIHILEGFIQAFDALDAVIAIIRASDGKAEAAARIRDELRLDAAQADALLELKLYRLANLEIRQLRDELNTKRRRAAEIDRALRDKAARWRIVREEIADVGQPGGSGDPRRTVIGGPDAEDRAFRPDDFIVDEDAVVLVSRDGWVKRQKDVRDPAATRLREGDALLAAVAGSTRATVVFFTSVGVAYGCRLIDIPASTGYGEPIQRRFRLKDGERVVAVLSLDPRAIGGGAHPRRHAVAVSSDGFALRFGLEALLDPSTRSGRRFARPAGTAEVVGVAAIDGSETLIAATRQARALLCPAADVNVLSGPGKGVRLIRIDPEDDRVLGFIASRGDRDLLTVETSRGATRTISTAKYDPTGRGGRGRTLLRHGQLTRIVPKPIPVPVLDAR